MPIKWIDACRSNLETARTEDSHTLLPPVMVRSMGMSIDFDGCAKHSFP
jgi:hypothetical protein